jgi:DNA-binding transcriptional MocR family regulator
MEYDTNTGKCFISDATLAEAFGVSAKTISRAIGNLEAKGFIKRETKNVKGGKERIMMPVIAAIEKALTKDNLSIDEDQPQSAQGTKCPLTTDNLTLDKGQNDLIKDNIKDNQKDNNSVLLPKGNKTETAINGCFVSQ